MVRAMIKRLKKKLVFADFISLVSDENAFSWKNSKTANEGKVI